MDEWVKEVGGEIEGKGREEGRKGTKQRVTVKEGR